MLLRDRIALLVIIGALTAVALTLMVAFDIQIGGLF